MNKCVNPIKYGEIIQKARDGLTPYKPDQSSSESEQALLSYEIAFYLYVYCIRICGNGCNYFNTFVSRFIAIELKIHRIRLALI